ncbi:ribonucleotide reductase subunit 1 [Aotine betaherpesvirus 1]|uniref:Ribonucleotide reductase subunit 1 n=1 Tax=Aotine betaherpesvirus 1 TaxID=50290 RepID=G8XUC0_9BETA|nr:ribonucleotide reductase subunit 1 [Aotine betaherpesvirus 1]AEV80750.1 ribonucleotide reductase subunit 1 [Aotine betaherpesvirus 1]
MSSLNHGWAVGKGYDFALWEAEMDHKLIQIGDGMRSIIVHTCSGVRRTGLGSGTQQQGEGGEGSGSPSSSPSPPAESGGLPAVPEEDVTLQRASSTPPVRRDGPSDRTRKCLCHGRRGPRRFCRSRQTSVSVYDVEGVLREIEDAVKRQESFSPVALYEVIVKYGCSLVKFRPRLDLLLGRYYHETNRGREHETVDVYCDSEAVEDEVARFFCYHRDYLATTFDIVEKIVKGLGCRGLVSAIITLDQIAVQLGGKEEAVAGICLRIVVYLVSLFQRSPFRDIYLHLFRVEGEMGLFERLLRRIQDGDLSLSVLASAVAGLVGSPGCDAVLASDRVEESDWHTVQRLTQSLAQRVSVSINVTRMESDAINLIRCLSAQRDLACGREPIKPTVCIYFDAWDIACAEILDYVVRGDCTGLHFIINIPDVIMKRRVAGGDEFALFGRGVSRRLSRLGNEAVFEKEYRRLEQCTRHLTACMRIFFDKLNTCLILGHMGVVFCHNVVRYSVMDYNVGIPACLGPDLASCNFTNHHLPVQRVCVNLSKCVHVCAQSRVSQRSYEDVFVGNNDRCFNFQMLREAVRDAVIVANARLDALWATSDSETRNALDKLRGLSIGVVGLQTTLSLMGMTLYENMEFAERIFENMYYHALRASADLCVAGLARFEWFARTVYSRGRFIYDKYSEYRLTIPGEDWASLRQDILEYGLRNGQFLALGPDEDVAQLLNVSPSVWAASGNVYEVKTPLHDLPSDESLRIPRADRYFLRMPVVNRAMLKYSDEEVEKIMVHDQSVVEKKEYEPFVNPVTKLEHHVLCMCYRGVCKFVDQCIALPIVRNYSLPITAPLDRLCEMYYFGMKVGVYKCCK